MNLLKQANDTKLPMLLFNKYQIYCLFITINVFNEIYPHAVERIASVANSQPHLAFIKIMQMAYN